MEKLFYKIQLEKLLSILTGVSSLSISIKPENSTSLKRFDAIDLPSHGGVASPWRPPSTTAETAVAGLPPG